MTENENEHIEKLICEGFDRTDWNAAPDHPDDFTMKPPEEKVPPVGENFPSGVSFLRRCSAYLFGRKRNQIISGIPGEEREALKTHIAIVLAIAAVTAIVMFAIYLIVVYSFFR